MNIENRLWETEDQFWKAGPEFYRRNLHPNCIMVFPDQAGILTAGQVIDSLAAAPR